MPNKRSNTPTASMSDLEVLESIISKFSFAKESGKKEEDEPQISNKLVGADSVTTNPTPKCGLTMGEDQSNEQS